LRKRPGSFDRVRPDWHCLRPSRLLSGEAGWLNAVIGGSWRTLRRSILWTSRRQRHVAGSGLLCGCSRETITCSDRQNCQEYAHPERYRCEACCTQPRCLRLPLPAVQAQKFRRSGPRKPWLGTGFHFRRRICLVSPAHAQGGGGRYSVRKSDQPKSPETATYRLIVTMPRSLHRFVEMVKRSIWLSCPDFFMRTRSRSDLKRIRHVQTLATFDSDGCAIDYTCNDLHSYLLQPRRPCAV